MEISHEDERPDARMLTEDKDKINRFSRLLTSRSDMREKLARREKLLQLHEDANEELLLLDDDAPVQYNVGDAFFFDAKADVEARVEATQTQLSAEIEGLRAQIEDASTEIAKLKATLYAKFGKVRAARILCFPVLSQPSPVSDLTVCVSARFVLHFYLFTQSINLEESAE
jgi:chaperonin cofactor prefoldin